MRSSSLPSQAAERVGRDLIRNDAASPPATNAGFSLAQAFTPGLVEWLEFLRPIYGANILRQQTAKAVYAKPPEGGS